jgi:hypothetical protein
MLRKLSTRRADCRIGPGADVYNVFNSNVVLTQTQNFGSALGQPRRILRGRPLRLTAQISF